MCVGGWYVCGVYRGVCGGIVSVREPCVVCVWCV